MHFKDPFRKSMVLSNQTLKADHTDGVWDPHLEAMLQQRVNIARGKLLKLTLQVSFGSLHFSRNMLKASAAYTALASCRYICAATGLSFPGPFCSLIPQVVMLPLKCA